MFFYRNVDIVILRCDNEMCQKGCNAIFNKVVTYFKRFYLFLIYNIHIFQ